MTLQELIEWIKRKKGATDIGVVDSCELELKKADQSANEQANKQKNKKEDKEDEKHEEKR